MGAINCSEFLRQEELLHNLRSGKYNYLLRNETVFISILLTEVFDKAFEL
jgi:hypothetical protein